MFGGVLAVAAGATAPPNRDGGLDLGGNASGNTRRISDGGRGFLNYELYKDSGRSTV